MIVYLINPYYINYIKYGIKDTELEWFKSYHRDRFQITSYNNVMSSPLPLTTGVPQGSVLGPCLFLLFINYLTSVVKYSAINIYADDTLIYVSDSDIVTAARKLQYDIDSIVNWFRKNKLTLSVEKTFTMFVGSRKRLQSISVFPQLTIHDKVLENKESAKYLGIIIDRHLSWNDQISDICQRLRPKIGIFGRLRHFLPFNALINVYKAIIQSTIDYGLSIWGSTNQSNTDMVQKLQNRCIRLLTGCFDYDVRSQEILANLNLMNVKQRLKYFTGLLVFKCLNSYLPYYMSDNIMLLNVGHSYNTRNDHLLYVPPSRTNFGQRSFSSTGPTLWNSIPNTVKCATNFDKFKRNLKRFLLLS